MYVYPNFKTKKEFKEATRKQVPMELIQPGLGDPAPHNGTVTVEGPHYPEPHRWYAQVTLRDGVIVKVD